MSDWMPLKDMIGGHGPRLLVMNHLSENEQVA